MRKSTLFISAALTTFMLVVMFGVASAYQNIVKSTQPMAVQPQPTAVEQMVNQSVAVVPPTQVVPTQVTSEVATAIASKVLGRTDLYSVEVTQFEGTDAYLVTFSSGDLVYVSLDGQILSISKLPVTTIVQKGSKPGASNNNNRNSPPVASGGGEDGGGEHEGGEHEGGDD